MGLLYHTTQQREILIFPQPKRWVQGTLSEWGFL
jgi:hypothetical protein